MYSHYGYSNEKMLIIQSIGHIQMLISREKNWEKVGGHPRFGPRREFHIGVQKGGGPHFQNPNFLVTSANWPNEQHIKKLQLTFASLLRKFIFRDIDPKLQP